MLVTGLTRLVWGDQSTDEKINQAIEARGSLQGLQLETTLLEETQLFDEHMDPYRGGGVLR